MTSKEEIPRGGGFFERGKPKRRELWRWKRRPSFFWRNPLLNDNEPRKKRSYQTRGGRAEVEKKSPRGCPRTGKREADFQRSRSGGI